MKTRHSVGPLLTEVPCTLRSLKVGTPRIVASEDLCRVSFRYTRLLVSEEGGTGHGVRGTLLLHSGVITDPNFVEGRTVFPSPTYLNRKFDLIPFIRVIRRWVRPFIL